MLSRKIRWLVEKTWSNALCNQVDLFSSDQISPCAMNNPLKLIHTATPDTTKLSCLRRVRFGGVNWTTQDCHRQKIRSLNTFRAIVQFPPARHTRHRQDCFVVSDVAVWIESARPPDRCVLRRSVHTATPDKTRQDCRACQSTAAAATQTRQAATPSRPTAHTRRRCTPRKCKHSVDCWIYIRLFTTQVDT